MLFSFPANSGATKHNKPDGLCPRKNHWVGASTGQGGIWFAKGVTAPPPSPPPPAPPPGLPPLWPPQSLLIDAGWHNWPEEWFGKFACHGRHAGERTVRRISSPYVLHMRTPHTYSACVTHKPLTRTHALHMRIPSWSLLCSARSLGGGPERLRALI